MLCGNGALHSTTPVAQGTVSGNTPTRHIGSQARSSGNQRELAVSAPGLYSHSSRHFSISSFPISNSSVPGLEVYTLYVIAKFFYTDHVRFDPRHPWGTTSAYRRFYCTKGLSSRRRRREGMQRVQTAKSNMLLNLNLRDVLLR